MKRLSIVAVVGLLATLFAGFIGIRPAAAADTSTSTTLVDTIPAHPVYGTTVNVNGFTRDTDFGCQFFHDADNCDPPIGTVRLYDSVAGFIGQTTSVDNHGRTGDVAIFQVSVNGLVAGVHHVTAVFEGSDEFGGSTSDTLDFTIAKAPTTATLTSPNSDPVALGQPITLDATVSPAGAIGTVTFFEGNQFLGNVSAVNGHWAESLTPPVGTHTYHAIFIDSSGNYLGSVSGDVTRTVVVSDTKTTLVSSANPSVFGQAITLTATVSVLPPATGTPAGQVTFSFDNATTVAPLVNGSASITVTPNPAIGGHNATATFAGSGLLKTSSAGFTQTVNKADTSTAVTPSSNGSSSGQAVTFTATVVPNAPGAGTPSGTVQFMDGANFLGAPVALSNGSAQRSVANLTVGNHDITAVYSGDANFNGGTSAALAHLVGKADSVTQIASSLNPSNFGQPVTFTATVALAAPGIGSPTGTVQFKDGSGMLGNPVPLAGSGATITVPSFVPGTHLITAVYSGDATTNPSTSAVVKQVVQCDHTYNATGSLTLGAGQSTCIDGVTVPSAIVVPAGATLYLNDSTVKGAISSNGAARILICNSTVVGNMTISGTAGPVVIGSPYDDSCAGNTISAATLTNNHGGVTVVGNKAGGGVIVRGTAGGATKIGDNTIGGGLSCGDDNPLATNAGHPNTVAGNRAGECTGAF
jgi:Big-like domain-containing protein